MTNSTSSYRPEIDGLRALSVLGVVFFHAGLSFQGGYVGVDVFFVISGFLITNLILKAIGKNKFSLSDFWLRRIRRILPAVQLMVIAVLIFGFVLLLPSDFKNLGGSSIAQALFAANFYFWLDTGYFQQAAEFKPLLHTWSLAVEEQFYFVFPLLLVFLSRFNHRVMLVTLWVIFIGSFLTSAFGVYSKPGATFFLLPTRAWELLAGGLLATRTKQRPNGVRDEITGCAGIVMILISMIVFTDTTPFPGVAAILPVGGAVLFISATSASQTWIGKMFSWGPLVWVGLISYSLYLWHWPVLVFMRHVFADMTLAHSLTGVAISFALATIAYQFVETPFRKKSGSPKELKQVLSFAVISTVAILACSGSIFGLNGVESRFSSQMSVLADDVQWTGSEYQSSVAQIKNGTVPAIGATGDPKFVLWGDSHAMCACQIVDQIALDRGVPGSAIVTTSIPPVQGLWKPALDKSGASSTSRNDAVVDYILANNVTDVILISRWSAMVEGYSAAEVSQELKVKNTAMVASDRKTARSALRTQLQAMTDLFTTHGIKTHIVQQVPETDSCFVAREFLLFKLYPKINNAPDSRYTESDHLLRQNEVSKILRSLESSSVIVYQSSTKSFDNGIVQNYLDRSLYRDNDHLSRFGCETILTPVITAGENLG